jgi:phage-related protein
MKRKVIFYVSLSGKCPVEEFLDSLPAKAVQKITWVLKLIEDLDVISTQYFKKLVNTDDIWECRISFGSNIYRLFGFFKDGSMVILTHGIIKKTQKTPLNDIKKAEAYKKDFLKNN